MAKAAESVNKKKAVRDYVNAHPDAAPKDIVAAMQEQGIEVSAATVYNLKWELKHAEQKTAAAAEAGGSQARR